ncbi:serine O-acetyltransferase [Modestobacter sp. SYSU DS0875]
MPLRRDVLTDLQAVGTGSLATRLLNRGFHALVVHRVAAALANRRMTFLAFLLVRAVQVLYGIDIDYRAQVAPGVVIRHGMGLVVGKGSQVGSGTLLFHGVTMGYTGTGSRPGYPQVGNDVIIGAGAVLLGGIHVGSGARVGANAVVLEDVPEGATAVGNPARILAKRSP